LTVTIVTRYDSGLFMGGGEIQAQKTVEALVNRGVQVQYFDPWLTDLGDLVHFFGPFPYYAELADPIMRSSVPFVVSPIFMSEPAGPGLKWRYARRKWFDRSRYSGWEWLFGQASRNFVLSRDEETRLRCAFPFIRNCVTIPNGVDERFASGDAAAFRNRFGIDRPFVLHCGRFEPRKNQLALIRALEKPEIPIVFIGEPTDRRYFQLCQAAANPAVRFLDPMPHDSNLLEGAYAACSVFALPSHREILSLAALEAAVAGKPLVLGNTWGAAEHFEGYARFVDPKIPAQILAEVVDAMERGDSPEQIQHYRTNYSWQSVAKRLIAEYEAVLKR